MTLTFGLLYLVIGLALTFYCVHILRANPIQPGEASKRETLLSVFILSLVWLPVSAVMISQWVVDHVRNWRNK